MLGRTKGFQGEDKNMSNEVSFSTAGDLTPWRMVGTNIPENAHHSVAEAIKASGLDWEVQTEEIKDIQDRVIGLGRLVVRSQDRKHLGIVGRTYEPLQNIDAFNWFQPFLDNNLATFETAGSLRDSSVIWVLAKLNLDDMPVVRDDVIRKYILLSNSHDGKLAVRISLTPIRVYCWNTLVAAHHSAESKFIRIRHSSNLQKNLELIRDTINLANQEFEATAEQYRLLARKNINLADLRKYVKLVLDVDENDDNLSTRTKNIIEEIVACAEVGYGNTAPGVAGTMWAAFNGITQYSCWNKGNDHSNRVFSTWFNGENAKMNARALEIALELCA